MEKMWAGRTDGVVNSIADDFNSSIRFDSRMYRQDIQGSIAHAEMLGSCGIISEQDAGGLIVGLRGILEDLEDGSLSINPDCEDIHMFVEQVLTERIGELGKKLHTARSRNDQVALDTRMYLRDETDEIIALLKSLVSAVTDRAEEYKSAVMPGYTHLQRAQPIVFGHHLMAYSMMLLRDIERLCDCKKRLNVCPIGSCALAGTTYPTDRAFEAAELGFDGICLNSIDGVSDRDFCLELLSDISIIMAHLSRFSEEIVLWSSWEFKFIELSDDFTTGSSIMPQKKNPDVPELARGKTGRVNGHLVGLLTLMKGQPLAYNKDNQEDKEPLFDTVDTVTDTLRIFADMVGAVTVRHEMMRQAALQGYATATDLADYLVKKGLPFRDAHEAVARAVRYCVEKGCDLSELTLEQMRTFSDLIESDVLKVLTLEGSVSARDHIGGTAPAQVKKAVAVLKERLGK